MPSLLLNLTFKELPSFGTGVDEWRRNPETAWCSFTREEMKTPWLIFFSALVIFAPCTQNKATLLEKTASSFYGQRPLAIRRMTFVAALPGRNSLGSSYAFWFSVRLVLSIQQTRAHRLKKAFPMVFQDPGFKRFCIILTTKNKRSKEEYLNSDFSMNNGSLGLCHAS